MVYIVLFAIFISTVALYWWLNRLIDDPLDIEEILRKQKELEEAEERASCR